MNINVCVIDFSFFYSVMMPTNVIVLNLVETKWIV